MDLEKYKKAHGFVLGLLTSILLSETIIFFRGGIHKNSKAIAFVLIIFSLVLIIGCMSGLRDIKNRE